MYKFIYLIFLPLFLINTVHAQSISKKESPFFDIDVSGSSGNYNGKSYTELHLGVNLNFTDWLTWRNSAFKKFGSSGAQDATGLDSSLRFVLNNKFEGGGLKFFGGPGYRFSAPSNQNSLFAEIGAGLNLGPLNVGAGAKYLRYDKAQFDSNGLETKRDDLNYFFTISGGKNLSF
jgi:hypothetical protein